MDYDPRHDSRPVQFDPFKSCTVPRPIGWLSTISTQGVLNLAPYSQWQNMTFDPPMVMFAANRYPDGRKKDTVVNAIETGWFVWNMATWDLRDAVNRSAQAFPADIDEFVEAGVTATESVYAPAPRVAESPCHF
ncbi:MAG: flavin reductase family protein [Granulosicoccus sp.]|nr:flavin reductase family protein [Granulosicoccus sp.]